MSLDCCIAPLKGKNAFLANRPDLLCVGFSVCVQDAVNSQERFIEWRRCKHPDPPIMASEGAPTLSHLLPRGPLSNPTHLQALFSTPPPHTMGAEKTKEIMALNPRAPHSWEPINTSSCFHQAPNTVESHISSSKQPCQLSLNDHTHFTGKENKKLRVACTKQRG